MGNPETELGTKSSKTDSRQPVPEEHRQRVAALVAARGLYYVAKRILGLGAGTVTRVLAGMPMQAGTRALIAGKIAERDAAGKNP
jgi:hypothetical protein